MFAKIGEEKKLGNKTQKINNVLNKKWLEENFNSFDEYGIIYKGCLLVD